MNELASTISPMIELTRDIVGAYVSNNNVPLAELPGLIAAVHAILVVLGRPTAGPIEDHKVTAAQIRKSVMPDAITSFLDGKPYKSLKRHLKTRGMTPYEYRQKFGLPFDYPMISATYAAKRSELAKSLGFGRQIRRERATAPKAGAVAKAAESAPAHRGRPMKTEAAAE